MFYMQILQELTKKKFDSLEIKDIEIKDSSKHHFKTFYEEKILKESSQYMNFPQEELKLSESKDFYNPKPEMRKFNIEGFNLNSIHKSNPSDSLMKSKKEISVPQLPQQNTKKFEIYENFWKYFEKLNQKEINFINFKLIFDKSIKNVISFYGDEIDKRISDYVFNKLSLLEYFHCLRSKI